MSKEQMIHDAAMEILRDVGVRFHNEEAIRILRSNGIRVEGETAYFTEEQVMHWVKMAPSSFTLYARNPQYNMILGTEETYPSPTYGCAFMAERDGTQRPGTIADYVKCVKLVQANPDYHINGGILVQPCEVDESTAPMDMFYAALTHSDKVMLLPTGSRQAMEAIMQACCAVFGGADSFAARPRTIALINTNSPLSLDGKMLDCLMVLAKYGQPAILCPAAMLGATGPLPMAGTLASGTAEDLAGIALAQMVRPGTPVVFGIQSTAADMHSILFACSAPEGTVMQGFGAKMARFYGLPSRGGGSQTDAPVVNAQAGYESMLTCYSAYRHGINLVMEAGGVVASVNATSIDKMICDFEIIRQVKTAFKPLEVNEETLDLTEIKEVGHDGSFLTTDYTLDHFMNLYIPRIGSRNAQSPTYFEDSIDKEVNRLLEAYEAHRPTVDAAVLEQVKAVFADAGVPASRLEAIEAL